MGKREEKKRFSFQSGINGMLLSAPVFLLEIRLFMFRNIGDFE